MEGTSSYSESGNDNLESYIRNRSNTIIADRIEFLYENFKQARQLINVKILEQPKGVFMVKKKSNKVDINGNIDEKVNGVAENEVKHNKKKNKSSVEKSRLKTYMTVEKSYIIVPENIINIAGENDDTIKKLVVEGRRKFPKTQYDKIISAVNDIFNVSKRYIKEILAEKAEKSNAERLVSGACSSTCYKVLKGIPGEMNLMSVGDETQVKRAILDSGHQDYCTLAESLNISCNIVYMLAKNVNSTSAPYQPLKKMKTVLTTSYSLFKKRNKQYEGLPLFYKPCDHDGECDESCPCFKSKNYCELFCCCTKDCKNKFYGCACKAKCDTKACPCFAASRECIEGVCVGGCKSYCQPGGTCTNMQMQFQKEKIIDIKVSTVAGHGAFAGENIKKGDFIVEYTGELISQDEAEKRGKYYDEKKISYLFDLSKDFAIDGQFMGNESRFLNHSDTPNTVVRFMTVLGDKRIGIYAERNIKKGEELFFNYNYDQLHKKVYFKK